MDLIIILGLAGGLSMDALAVSVANGFMIKELKFHHAFRIAFSFGFFQAIMPLVGWAAGSYFSVYVSRFDHWIAFALLAFIGGKMIVESRSLHPTGETMDCLHFPTLFTLSIATSVDALSVGLTFAFLEMSILTPIIIIGTVTFLVCIVGIYIGDKIGHLFENRLELGGGIVLIAIGFKILVDHLFFKS